MAIVLQTVRGTRRIKGNRLTDEEVEILVNYLIDLLIRCGCLLDRQLNAVEKSTKPKVVIQKSCTESTGSTVVIKSKTTFVRS